jgi:hypothetical protein
MAGEGSRRQLRRIHMNHAIASRPTKTALLLLLVATTVLAFASPAAARGARDQERAIKLLAQLEMSSNPEAAYLALGPSDRELVRWALTPAGGVTMTTVTRVPSSAVADGSRTPSAFVAACWQFQRQFIKKSTIGVHLFGYEMITNWCGNGATITSKQTPVRKVYVYQLFWEFDRHEMLTQTGGVGSTFWRAYAQGHFKFCPPLLGCSSHAYPWLNFTHYPDGGVFGTMGG